MGCNLFGGDQRGMHQYSDHRVSLVHPKAVSHLLVALQEGIDFNQPRPQDSIRLLLGKTCWIITIVMRPYLACMQDGYSALDACAWQKPQ